MKRGTRSVSLPRRQAKNDPPFIKASRHPFQIERRDRGVVRGARVPPLVVAKQRKNVRVLHFVYWSFLRQEPPSHCKSLSKGISFKGTTKISNLKNSFGIILFIAHDNFSHPDKATSSVSAAQPAIIALIFLSAFILCLSFTS